MQTRVQRSAGLVDQPVVDGWLRFVPAVQARYDLEQSAARVENLRWAILIGLSFVHLYNISSLLLTPDIARSIIAFRVFVFTPTSLALYWLIGRTPPRWTELLVLGGMLNALMVTLAGFWLTHDPRGLYTFGELFLSVVFGNMLLALRFPHAVLFTLSALVVTLLAIATKPAMGATVQIAFAVQMATACAFALCANYRLERRRCDDYVAALEAVLEAEAAETARRAFQRLSRTDALTGLPNRRHLSETIKEWWSLPGELAVMMIDIDHFKPYNDRLGHPAGDECLRRVAEHLQATARGADVFCARFGGEEFAVVVRVGNEDEATRWARRLVLAVRSARIPHPARPDGKMVMTVSVGAAMRRKTGAESPAALFALADAALYEVKHHGRNGFRFGEARPPLREAG